MRETRGGVDMRETRGGVDGIYLGFDPNTYV
jgi:hypothetical protein